MTSLLQEMLREQLRWRRERNPRFSLRAFARFLDVSPSYLSEMMRGKQRPARPMVYRLCRRLNLTPARAATLADQIDGGISPPGGSDFYEFPGDRFRLVADWYHLGILAALEVAPEAGAQLLAQRLGVDRRRVRAALERMERLGLIARNQAGHWCPTHADTRVADGISPDAMKQFHHQVLQRAQRAIDTQSSDERFLQASVFAVSPEGVERLRELSARFTAEAQEICRQHGGKSGVYLLASQLVNLWEEP